MDPKLSPPQNDRAGNHPPLAGPHPPPCRRPSGRPPNPTLDLAQSAQTLIQVLRSCFPHLNRWFNELPDPRRQDRCRYEAAHLWWQILATYLFRAGSRNALDEQRNTEHLPLNLGELCGQKAEDPRFGGQPTITCSDNAARQARRVDPAEVAKIPLEMLRTLWERRLFDHARLFDHWYVVLVDGTVQEKCREGFEEDGKTTTGRARYRYVLQALMLGPEGLAFPFMHEAMDVHNPQTEKEDCELQAFLRLSQRLKEAFPRLPICWVGDALYSCQATVECCQRYGWKYIWTLKEGRQPATWEELIALLPHSRDQRLSTRLGPGGQTGRLDYCWAEHLMLGPQTTQAILAGEITAHSATLYAFMTNFANLTPERVLEITRVGRERHRIEDTFNTEKNHGIGLEHVFCAEPNAAKNYYTLLQVALILWICACHGGLKRLFNWARKATEQGLAKAIWDGLRMHRLPPDVKPMGQIRFGFT